MISNPIESYLKDLVDPQIPTVFVITNQNTDLTFLDDLLDVLNTAVPSTPTITPSTLELEPKPHFMTIRDEETVEALGVQHDDQEVNDEFRVPKAPSQPFSSSTSYFDPVKTFSIDDVPVSKWKQLFQEFCA